VSIASGGKGDITESHVRWENKKGLPYVASPLLYRNRLYYVKNGGFVTCVDPASGTPHYERARLGVSGEYYASPIGVGDKILFAGKKGSIVILKATDEFEIEARIDLEDSIYATPAVVDNHLYVRSEGFLWSFGQ
jgi:outer membrane protein assembly factor BamB